MRTTLILATLLSFFSLISYADDAVEAVAPGEITFEKSPDLLMLDETLTITKLNKTFLEQDFKVDVDFHFKNTSNKDIKRKVVFVLPPVMCTEENHSMWRGWNPTDPYAEHEKGLKDFVLTVDGKKVNYTLRVTAKMGAKDITAELLALHLPLNPCMIHFTKEGHLDPKVASVLASHHWLSADESAGWAEHILFEWTQVFPAGKTIAVSHHYTPVAGSMVPSTQTLSDINRYFTDSTPPYKPIWSRSPITLEQTNPSDVYKPAVNASASPEPIKFCVLPSWILYRLTTGANWNGGIGHFRLNVIDQAGAPFAINTFYSPTDVVETTKSPTQMSFAIQHFVPQHDLKVQYLSLPQTKEDLKTCGMTPSP